MKQFFRTVKAVLWSFIGIRKKSMHEQDVKLNPIHIIITALILTILFICSLLAIVSYVIKG